MKDLLKINKIYFDQLLKKISFNRREKYKITFILIYYKYAMWCKTCYAKKKSYDGSNFDHKNSSIKLTTIVLLETSILFTLHEIEQHIEGKKT